VVQLTPPGSACSVIFGTGVAATAPGSVEQLILVVDDIRKARAEIAGHGVTVSEVFHDKGGVFHRAGPAGRVAGPDPDGKSYASFASFSDPDGNGWLLQEVTARLPGRIAPGQTSFRSADELASAMTRASAAHGEHEKRIGHADADWPGWYARYMVAEQGGAELPQ
jgi:hypothetical protein